MPEPGVSRTSAHLIEVARCPILERLFEQGVADEPCSKVAGVQWDADVGVEERRARWRMEHQLPEPWSGNLGSARVLFISSNPSIGGKPARAGASAVPAEAAPLPSDEVLASHPSLRYGVGAHPRWSWTDDEIIDFYDQRFVSRIAPGGRFVLPDGRSGGYQRFWGWAEKRLKEIIPDGAMGVDGCLTELVRCKSRDEIGVRAARPVCTKSFLARTIAESGARLIVAVGAHASRHFDLTPGELRPPGVIEGRERQIISLCHPSSGRNPMRFSTALEAAELASLRAFLR